MEIKEVIKDLRRPFKPAEVNYKIQTVGTKAALCVAYVDARHVQERLNAVCGGLWENEFREVIVSEELRAVECRLSLLITEPGGIGYTKVSHSDVGSFDNVNEDQHGLKAVYSDAFKRAAVHFGVAVCLYSHPTSFLDFEYCRKHPKTGKVSGLKSEGEEKLRGEYRKWLKDQGVEIFGMPYELPEP